MTIQRLYKEGDKWRRTQKFGRDDVLVVAKVADLAHTRIYELQQEGQQES